MCWDHLIEAEHPQDRMQANTQPASSKSSLDRLLESLLKPAPAKPEASGE